jgi:phosphopantetheine adenylyltransferase
MSAGLHLNRFFWTLSSLFPTQDNWYEMLSADEIREMADRFTDVDELLPELAQGV